MNEEIIYTYDGTFNDLINLIARLIKDNKSPTTIIEENKYKYNLFDKVISYDVDEKTVNLLIHNLTKEIIKTIFNVYLSENKAKELIIYYFTLNSLKYKNEIFKMINLKCVYLSTKVSKYVTRETHKFKGFTRFKLLKNNILYAEISPTNNILFLLSLHFKQRLKKEKWVIKDTKRNIYSIYQKNDFYIIEEKDFIKDKIILDEDEDNIENLWFSFFKTIGINERQNKKLQMNQMPKKYWKYIIEMREENEKSN